MNARRQISVDQLLGIIAEEDEDERLEAIYALSQIGRVARQATPVLLERLPSAGRTEQGLLLYALSEIGCRELAAAPLLIAFLGESDQTRSGAMTILESIGAPSVPLLVECLRAPTIRSRHSAAAVLRKLGAAAESAVPALTAALKDPSSFVRRSAAEALMQIGEAAAEAVPQLVEGLSDPEWDVRFAVLEALDLLGRGAGDEAALAVLPSLLDDHDSVRLVAARALGSIGSKRPEVIAGLSRSRDEDKRQVQLWSAAALARLEVDVARGLDLLTEEMHHTDPWRAQRPIMVLAWLGPTSLRVLPYLVQALNDHEWVRGEALKALAVLGATEPDAISAVAELLGAETFELRRSAAATLGHMGSAAASALRHSLEDPNDCVKVAAARGLVRIGEHAELAITTIITILEDPARSYRCEAAEALGEIGQHERTRPALERALDDLSSLVWQSAERALEQLNR